MLSSPNDAIGDGQARLSVDRPEQCSDYLLVCEATSNSLCEGQWHFTLETADGVHVFDAGDTELGDLNRLTLLAAVRGLEAIDGAASVTLLSNNRYLVRSLTDSLPRWRDNDFVWEHFGRRIDVQHADLWRRIDRALTIHRVEACLISSRVISAGHNQGSDSDDRGWVRVDSPHPSVDGPKLRSAPKDRLRRWLLAGASKQKDLPRQRLTAADLMEIG
ncbi:MAG: ribonuclease HI [Pirellulales bacterium]|nr:ribonuclease HI [Pirellulales bacterium]